MLKVGDPIPDLSLPNDQGQKISLRKLVGEQPLVVYFYPKNNTPGCTIEACSFRDHYASFQELNTEVIGISGDSTESHQQVKSRLSLPFPLLSDIDRQAEKAFGVQRNLFGLLPGRVTFIFDKHGKVAEVFDSALQPARHIKVALEKVSGLNT